ncbi:MAG: FAD-dependent oxidoreductase [Bacteroidota bacterium]
MKYLIWLGITVWLTTCFTWFQSEDLTPEYDLVIYGATFSGIAAAINAAEYGHQVALVEEYDQIGGLMTSGLSNTDFISFESLSGTFLDYCNRVEKYYIDNYGADSQQVEDCHAGIHAEPHVTLKIFQEMLAEHSNIQVYLNHRLESVSLGAPRQQLRHIERIKCLSLTDSINVELAGQIFLDATYEGDLAAFAGAEYRVGRESRQKYGEPLAGHIFYQNGRILKGSTGEGDRRVQGYNFRVIMTDDPENRRLIDQPDNYHREEYLPIAEVLKQGKVSQVFTRFGRDAILRTQMIPNRKADVNDIKNAPVRIALLGENYAYPEGSPKVRAEIVQHHQEHILGLLYFLQNDTEVPEKYRREARQWGLAKDEFIDNDNFPPRLYIREARRIMGEYVFTQNDVTPQQGTLVNPFKNDAIAIGDYALNCHGVQPPSLHSSVAEGDYNLIPAPFQIPFGTIIPRRFSNLLVSVAISSSHVGFSGIRLEPVWTSLGQAAGLAAHLALIGQQMVGEVSISELQRLLHHHKSKTTYISDIEASSPLFEATQFLGVRGYLHDLYTLDTLTMVDTTTYRSLWGGQYAAAYPFHALEPEKELEGDLAQRWIRRLDDERLQTQAREYLATSTPSRGEFLLEIYSLLSE